MSEEKQIPEWVWCDEEAWDWQRYLIGMPDDDVKRIIEKIKHQVIQGHSMSYAAGYEEGAEHRDRDIKDSADRAWEDGYEKGCRDGAEEAERSFDRSRHD